MPDHEISPMGRAALAYAKAGYPVFPIVPLRKTPLTTHGLHDASLSPRQIEAWWRWSPRANLAIRTGPRTAEGGGCGFDVIDCDSPEAIEALREAFARSGESAPEVLALSETPRGIHVWVPASGSGNRAGMLPGVDLRGEGGYVVAPPSISPSGGYLWIRPPAGLVVDPRTVIASPSTSGA